MTDSHRRMIFAVKWWRKVHIGRFVARVYRHRVKASKLHVTVGLLAFRLTEKD